MEGKHNPLSPLLEADHLLPPQQQAAHTPPAHPPTHPPLLPTHPLTQALRQAVGGIPACGAVQQGGHSRERVLEQHRAGGQLAADKQQQRQATEVVCIEDAMYTTSGRWSVGWEADVQHMWHSAHGEGQGPDGSAMVLPPPPPQVQVAVALRPGRAVPLPDAATMG